MTIHDKSADQPITANAAAAEKTELGHLNTLLSVDWDYFFPIDETGADAELYDWGHHEEGFFVDGPLWNGRAASFLAAGKKLPGTTGEERNFWKRFRFSPEAQLYVADSHSRAVDVGIPQIIFSYDAHHDCGYKEEIVSQHKKEGYVACDDWLAFMIERYGSDATVYYPPWRPWRIVERKPVIPVHRLTDSGHVNSTPIDAVFVCRSGAWTPPWLDEEFQTFLYACPIATQRQLQDTTPRDFNVAEAEAIAKTLQRVQIDATAFRPNDRDAA